MPRPRTFRRWLAPGFSVVLTAATLFFVLRGIDREVFARLLMTQSRGLLVVATLLMFLQLIFGGLRWSSILRALIRGPLPRISAVLAVFYGSIFFNYLPIGTVGGDVARVWLARRLTPSLGQIVLSILVDRVVTVVAFVVLALATLPTVPTAYVTTIWLGGAGILLTGALGIVLLGVIERLIGRWGHQRLIHLVLRVAEDLRLLLRRGGLPALCFAVVSSACAGLAAYAISQSLGISVGLVPMLAVTSLMSLIVALPISVAGWGVREVSLVALLGIFGVDREAALVLSVEIGLINTLLCLPGGVIWLMLRGRRHVVVTAE
jgi:uncharacterized membrane protein YbhN (UPF0104 family)